MPCAYHILSPPSRGDAAIAIVDLRGDVAAVLAAIGAGEIPPPRVVLCDLPGIDTMVIARPAEKSALLFPHGGPAIMRRVTAAIERAGATPGDSTADTGAVGQDAAARLDHALSVAASPLAIDLLLDQPRRWEAGGADPLPPDRARQLRRLIIPPLVVLRGPPNVGKSSLVNALAGRGVSVVADEPGTTRDHVGVLIDCAGLVVRLIDTPGVDVGGATSDIQRQSQAIAGDLAAAADLIIECGDAASGFLPAASSDGQGPPATVVRAALRADLGVPHAPHDLAVSVRYRSGLDRLVALSRERLIPASTLADPRPWAFWSAT